MTESMFPALLRYWRNARGLSQLDLAAAAEVSPKHVSFLETSRSHPSREMVLRLGATLGLPLREQNALLEAAGFTSAFGDATATFDVSIQRALQLMLEKQEPYPLLVFDRNYDVALMNRAARRMVGLVLGPRANAPLNVMKLLFDPELLRPFVLHWEHVARVMLNRLQREDLLDRRDDRLRHLLSALCSYPGVPKDWRRPSLELPSEPLLTLNLQVGPRKIGFLSTVTVFSAPQNVAVEELHIESYYPLDAETQAFCEELAVLPETS